MVEAIVLEEEEGTTNIPLRHSNQKVTEVHLRTWETHTLAGNDTIFTRTILNLVNILYFISTKYKQSVEINFNI